MLVGAAGRALGAQLLKLNLKSFSLVAANIYYDDIIMLLPVAGATVPAARLRAAEGAGAGAGGTGGKAGGGKAGEGSDLGTSG